MVCRVYGWEENRMAIDFNVVIQSETEKTAIDVDQDVRALSVP
jgi:hypothetical protein